MLNRQQLSQWSKAYRRYCDSTQRDKKVGIPIQWERQTLLTVADQLAQDIGPRLKTQIQEAGQQQCLVLALECLINQQSIRCGEVCLLASDSPLTAKDPVLIASSQCLTEESRCLATAIKSLPVPVLACVFGIERKYSGSGMIGGTMYFRISPDGIRLVES